MLRLHEETFAAWIKEIQEFEYNTAIKRIAAGENTDVVLEQMANRIMNKILHYHIVEMKSKAVPTDTGKEAYKQNYIDKIAVRADHVSDDT